MFQTKIAIVTHVNPFYVGSGQVQRVYNTLLAVAETWDLITIYTCNEQITLQHRVTALHEINSNIEIIYAKAPFYLKYISPLFHLFFYLGFGKASNWQLPIIFKNIQSDLLHKKHQKIIFEYWHLYDLAAKVKSKNNLVICDTHDILSNAYVEHLNTINWMPAFYKNFLLTRYKRLEFEVALQKFDMLIAINKKEEEFFLAKFPNKKIYFCPMGVKFPKLDSQIKNKFKKKHTFKIIYYGGLGSSKNANDALKVFEVVKELNIKNNNSIKYVIVGSNPSKSFLDILNEDKNVEVVGFVEDLSTVFEDIDLAVIPFTGKYGFRSRLIELMFYGVPILTTNDSVWGMGFEHNKNIFIYENDNNLSDDLMQLLNDYVVRSAIVCNAKIKVNEEFTFESSYLKLAQDLL